MHQAHKDSFNFTKEMNKIACKVCMILPLSEGSVLIIKSTPLRILATIVIVSINPSLTFTRMLPDEKDLDTRRYQLLRINTNHTS